MQNAASAANQRLNTLHTGAWPAPPAGEPRYHAPTGHCRKLMVASTDHSSGDRPGWTNTKSTGRCLSIFVFFRKWIVWQLPSMVLKWKAPQSLLCHRSRQWQLQQCRSLNTPPPTLSRSSCPRAFPFLYGSNFLLPYFNSSSVPHFQSYFSNSEIKFTVTKCQYLMSFIWDFVCTICKVSEFLWYLPRP